jgi:Na+:H+ antiporter, NhaA family
MARRRRLPVRAARTWRDTPIAGVIRPIENFVHQSTSSGIILLIATVVALLLANIPATAPLYFGVLESYITIDTGLFHIEENVLHWINDGLMAIFFLLVGLEIKREVAAGELSNPRAALLPIAAAIGGVVVPALIYVAFNFNGDGFRGWGVPMATDIAFALGCLALLGKRVPFSLKVFLTAVAIVDDLIAVLVIAIFYSGGLNFAMLGLGFLVLGVLVAANVLGIRTLTLYLGLGLIVWYAFLESGVHATIAGVLIALTIPARYAIDDRAFADKMEALLERFKGSLEHPTRTTNEARLLTDEHQNNLIQGMETASEQALAPLQRLEHQLHTPVQFIIMPIFALANAGVSLNLNGFDATETAVALGIVLGLVVGKPIGILAGSYLVVRAGWAELPGRTGWNHMVGAGILAGIGFTMSLFIASLGFGEGSELLNSAKIAILVASLIAGGVGMTYLSRAKPLPDRVVTVPDTIEAEPT